MNFSILDKRYTREHLGFLPSFLSVYDPRPAKVQLHENYAHGGGWSPYGGFTYEPKDNTLSHKGDPPLKPIACTKLRDEWIYIYPHAWVMILQPDGKYEVARMD